MGAAVALADLQIDQETGHWFGVHGGSPISMQSQLTWQDLMARHGVGDELLRQVGALAPPPPMKWRTVKEALHLLSLEHYINVISLSWRRQPPRVDFETSENIR